MSVVRSIWVALNMLVATFVHGTAVIVLSLLGYEGPLHAAIAQSWCRWGLWCSGARVYVEGLEHLAADRPQILVANHVSWYDVFAIGAVLPKHFRFVAKKELEAVPLFGRAWRAAGHISIDRSNRGSAIESLARAGEALRSDNSAVVIFAEGTRSDTGELQPFKKGAFMLALGTGVEIVPTAVVGTRRILAKGHWRVRSGPIIVRFGSPVDPSLYTELTREELVDCVRARVSRLLTGPEAASLSSQT